MGRSIHRGSIAAHPFCNGCISKIHSAFRDDRAVCTPTRVLQGKDRGFTPGIYVAKMWTETCLVP